MKKRLSEKEECGLLNTDNSCIHIVPFKIVVEFCEALEIHIHSFVEILVSEDTWYWYTTRDSVLVPQNVQSWDWTTWDWTNFRTRGSRRATRRCK